METFQRAGQNSFNQQNEDSQTPKTRFFPGGKPFYWKQEEMEFAVGNVQGVELGVIM